MDRIKIERCQCDAVRYAEAAAKRLGLNFQLVDTHSGYLCRVRDGSKDVVIGGGSINSWPINNATATTIASDKAFSAILLKEIGLSVPRSETVFLSDRFRSVRSDGREVIDAPRIAESIGWPVIAKPNNGSRGAYVQLCKNTDDLLKHLEAMGQRYDVGLLQEYLEGDEYRVLVYKDSAVFCYKKRRSAILSDGKTTLRELLHAHNLKLVGVGLDPIAFNYLDLTKFKITTKDPLDFIPLEGSIIAVGARANLSAGGIPDDFTTEVPNVLREIAIRATRAIGLQVAGVDIVVSRREDREEHFVLEVNSNPTISSLEIIDRIDIAVELYSDLIATLLAEARHS